MSMLAAVLVILLSGVVAVAVAVVVWSPKTPGDVLVYAVAGLGATVGIGATVAMDQRRSVTPPAVRAADPGPTPDMLPPSPACSPPHGSILAAPDEDLRSAMLRAERERWGG